MTIIIESSASGDPDNSQPTVLFDSVLTRGTLVASTEATDGAGSNATNGKTNDFWTPTALPATLETTLSAAEECDCAAIVGHTLGTDGATLEVDYHDGATWQTLSTTSPTTDETIFIIFGAQTRTRWRIRITGSTIPSIAVALIGKRLSLPGGVTLSYTPIYKAKDVELLSGVSRKGHFIGNRVQRRGASTTISLAPIDRSWIESNLDPFNNYFDDGGAFVFASAPSVFTKDAAYCWRGNSTLRPSHSVSGDLEDISMQVNAYVE